MNANTGADATIHNDIELVRTRDQKFVGALMVLGVRDLPFVDSGTKFLEIEKKRMENALFIKITGQEARP